MKFIVDIMFGVVIEIDEDHGVTQIEVEAFENWRNRNGIKYYSSTKYNIMYLKLWQEIILTLSSSSGKDSCCGS